MDGGTGSRRFGSEVCSSVSASSHLDALKRNEGHRRRITKAEIACSSHQRDHVVRALICAKPLLRRHGAREAESRTDMVAIIQLCKVGGRTSAPAATEQTRYVECFGKSAKADIIGSKEADRRD